MSYGFIYTATALMGLMTPPDPAQIRAAGAAGGPDRTHAAAAPRVAEAPVAAPSVTAEPVTPGARPDRTVPPPYGGMPGPSTPPAAPSGPADMTGSLLAAPADGAFPVTRSPSPGQESSTGPALEPATTTPPPPLRTSAPSPGDSSPERAYMAHLASYGTEASAQEGWKKLKVKAAALSQVEPAFVTVDIPGKGPMVRLMVGSFSREDARIFCGAVKPPLDYCQPMKAKP